ncbi:MAG: hypothetical protein ACTSO9_19435 [Candidatus Helarchaeota archaeon]
MRNAVKFHKERVMNEFIKKARMNKYKIRVSGLRLVDFGQLEEGIEEIK